MYSLYGLLKGIYTSKDYNLYYLISLLPYRQIHFIVLIYVNNSMFPQNDGYKYLKYIWLFMNYKDYLINYFLSAVTLLLLYRDIA